MKEHSNNVPNADEPSAEELNEIERESGLIAAEMALLDAEIRIMTAEYGPSSVDWQRLRRAIRKMLRETAVFYTHSAGEPEETYPDAPEGHVA